MIEVLQKLPKLNNVDGRIVLSDLYDTHYGIYDHLAKRAIKRPLASVAMHPSEDINDGSLLEEACHAYISKGIKDLFGLSLLEFLELPIDVVDMLFNISNEQQSEKAKTLADVERQFNKH